MSDTVSKSKRSEIMSKVKGKNTKLELRLRKALWEARLRGYRLHHKLPGSPDIVFTRAKVAIFIDGCFWHGCPQCYTKPKDNAKFWEDKLVANINRDSRNNEDLIKLGWKPLRFWQHQIKEDLPGCVKQIEKVLNERRK